MSEPNLAAEAIKLRALYDHKQALGQQKKEADAEHKAQEQLLLDLSERLGVESVRPRGFGYTFTAVYDKVKGRIEDRRKYVEWALPQEPSLDAFEEEFCDIERATSFEDAQRRREEFRAALHQAIQDLSIVKVTERQELINTQARNHVDDEAPLPPGLGFTPEPYFSVTATGKGS